MSYSINYPYTTAGTSVTTGTVYTVNTSGSTNGLSWNGAGLVDNQNISPAALDVKGKAVFQTDVEIEGDLKIQGKSIKDSLDRIEERLAILRPNEELEEKWDQLRGLRKMYMELEQEIIEKEAMWKILKK